MHVQKISKAVTSALAYLESTIDLSDESSEEEVKKLTWRAASDLEYGLFLFSIIHPEEDPNSSLKLHKTKQLEIKSLLASTRNLLREALEGIKVYKLKEAHEKTLLARCQLLRLHDFLEKR